MCGLVAVFGRDFVKKDTVDRVNAAIDSMSYRGLPGRRGIHCTKDAVLGHVRLPIVGLDVNNDQPLIHNDAALAFVGEVHNYKDLSPGAVCDSEVVLNAWLSGIDNWRRFDGFWSATLVDEKNGVGCVAVDYLAQKPLYLRRDKCAVASELRPLFAFGVLTLDETYLSNVLKWGYDPTGRTPYLEVEKIPPGCAITFPLIEGLGSTRAERYFSLTPKINTTRVDLASLVDRSVKARLVSDVPVATLLSGGLDSTIVSILAKKADADIVAFHVENDEWTYARDVATQNRFNIKRLELSHDLHAEAMSFMQEPVDLGSVLPQFLLGRAVSFENYHVALSGDGADELFGGYSRASQYDSQWSDVFCELVHYHIPKLDRCMMASAVELRCPFLAPYVVEAALGLDWSKRKNKEILRKAFSDIVPESVINRKKMPLRTHDPKDASVRKFLVDDFRKGFNRHA